MPRDFARLLVLHIVALRLDVLDHKDGHEEAANKDDTSHAKEDVLLIVWVLVDALVDEDEGYNFSDFLA